MNATRQIAQFVEQARYADIPAAIIDEFKVFVLDTVGAGFIGTVQPWTKTIFGMVRSLGGTPAASVWSTRLRYSAPTAALVNSTTVHAFEIDDVAGIERQPAADGPGQRIAAFSSWRDQAWAGPGRRGLYDRVYPGRACGTVALPDDNYSPYSV